MAAEDRSQDAVRLLDVRHAAHFLGTTPKTLYTMVWRREIVFVKIGRSLRFDLKDLEQMIEKGKVRPSRDRSGRPRPQGRGNHGDLSEG
jgi:excisionase family DNA binding protein